MAKLFPEQMIAIALDGHGLRFSFWEQGVVCTVFGDMGSKFSTESLPTSQSPPCVTASVATYCALTELGNAPAFMGMNIYEVCEFVDREKARREADGANWPTFDL